MNITGSNIKHPMSPKAYQIMTIQDDSKESTPKVKRAINNGSEYLSENMEPLSLPQKPLPSGLLLQGGRGSIHSSSEFSCSEGVCLVRK